MPEPENVTQLEEPEGQTEAAEEEEEEEKAVKPKKGRSGREEKAGAKEEL